MKILKKESPRAKQNRKALGLDKGENIAMTMAAPASVEMTRTAERVDEFDQPARMTEQGGPELPATLGFVGEGGMSSPVAQAPVADVTAATTIDDPGSSMTEVHYLSDEAFQQRTADVGDETLRSIAAEPRVKAWAEKLAMATNRDLAVLPITLQEYVDYRDTEVAKKASNPKASRTFKSATFEKLVRTLPNQGLKDRIFAKFAGKEGIGDDEVLIALAEMFASSDKGRRANTKLDSGVEVCANPACETVPDKKFVPTIFDRFVPSREDKTQGTMKNEGQFLAVDGEVKPYCRVCKRETVNGIFAEQKKWRVLKEEERAKIDFPKMPHFLSKAEAEQRAGRQDYAINRAAEEKRRDDERDAERKRHQEAIRKGALGTLGSLMSAKRRDERTRDGRGKTASRLSEETRKKSHLNIGEALSGDPQVKGIFSVEGVFKTRNGNDVPTFVAIRFGGGTAEILEGGPIFADMVGKSGSAQYLPGPVQEFLRQIQDAATSA